MEAAGADGGGDASKVATEGGVRHTQLMMILALLHALPVTGNPSTVVVPL